MHSGLNRRVSFYYIYIYSNHISDNVNRKANNSFNYHGRRQLFYITIGNTEFNGCVYLKTIIGKFRLMNRVKYKY